MFPWKEFFQVIGLFTLGILLGITATIPGMVLFNAAAGGLIGWFVAAPMIKKLALVREQEK